MREKAMRMILVHGGGHGAWCWYKVVSELKCQGRSVMAIDLAACGSDPRRMPEDISTFDEYSEPLMELMAAVPQGERIVLVGHSFGGLSVAQAMDAFPEKIAVAVFVTAMMPDTTHAPWYIVEQLFKQLSAEAVNGIKYTSIAVPGRSEPFIATHTELNFLETRLYQNCTFEDLTLANLLLRPGSLFQEDLSNKPALSEQRYGSVDKVFIISGEDNGMTADFQKWMIQNNPVKEEMEIKGADHMAMLSKPHELCHCLTTILNKYANI